MTQDTTTEETMANEATTATVDAPEPVAATLGAKITISKDQVRHVADAVIAEAVRKLGKAMKPADAKLFDGIALRAVKLQVDELGVDPTDPKAVKAIARRKAQLATQFGDVRAFASDQGAALFMQALERVFARLTTLAITAVVAAL